MKPGLNASIFINLKAKWSMIVGIEKKFTEKAQHFFERFFNRSIVFKKNILVIFIGG